VKANPPERVIRSAIFRSIIPETLGSAEVLVNTIPDIIYELDESGKFVFVSNAICDLGYTSKELIGKFFFH
jgi:PAS domain-containing protein